MFYQKSIRYQETFLGVSEILNKFSVLQYIKILRIKIFQKRIAIAINLRKERRLYQSLTQIFKKVFGILSH